MKFLPNLNFLRYFYSAGKHQSVTKAAEENFVTQSAISQGIKKIELELGKNLISNKKNHFELTHEGMLLLEKCESIFSLFSNIEDLFNEESNVYKGKLIFATSHSFAITLLPFHYKNLFQQHPDVEPILRLGHAGIIREWISKGEVEFGIIVAKEKDFLAFHHQPILQGHYGVYKAKKGTKQILNRLIISEDSYEDNLLLSHLKKKRKTIPPVIEVLSWEVIANMIEQGLGEGILPDYVARRYGLRPVSVDIPAIPYKIIAISSKNKGLSRNARMFIDLMQNGQVPTKGA